MQAANATGQARERPRFRDAGAVVQRRYDAHTATAYLVRPDGHVAWRGKAMDGDGLLAHLRGVLGTSIVAVARFPAPV